jgi:hypothetical protein
MANFFKPASGEASGWVDQANGIVTTTLGAPLAIGLADDWTRDGDPAEVSFNDPSFGTVTRLPMLGGNKLLFKIECNRIGNCMLEARDPPTMGRFFLQMPLRASIQIAVIAGAVTSADRLSRAYYESRIFFTKGYESAERLFLMALNHDVYEGMPVEHSPQLENALASLANIGTVQIMRTFAPNNSFHGEKARTRWVCSCADIMGYAGNRYEWHEPKPLLISGVARLIRDLPTGAQYDFGFVRPVGGRTGSMPSADVFFRVETLEQIGKAYRGDARNRSEILPDAAVEINPALDSKNVGFVYADGADHMHVRAYAP